MIFPENAGACRKADERNIFSLVYQTQFLIHGRMARLLILSYFLHHAITKQINYQISIEAVA